MLCTAARWLALGAAILVVAGCAGQGGESIEDALELRTVTIRMARDANDRWPATVELVRVDDERLVRELVGISAEDWFADQGRAFRAANPTALSDVWEIVPGEESGPHDARVEDGEFAGVLFCDTKEAAPPMRLEYGGRVELRVSETGCEVEGGVRREPFLKRLRRNKFVALGFEMPAGANDNRPVRVELVRTSKPEQIEDLIRLDSKAWFGAVGPAFRRENPDVLFDDWELVPGGDYGPFRLAVDQTLDAVLFCATPSGAPMRIDWEEELAVHVDDEGCRSTGEVEALAVVPTAADRPLRRFWNPLTWSFWR